MFCILKQFIIYWCLLKKNIVKLASAFFQPSEVNIKIADKIRYSCYMVHVLVPLLKELCREQMMEKEIEAKIQGMASIMVYLKLFTVACFHEK